VNGQINLKKLLNAAISHLSHVVRSTKGSKYPIIISFELWNECNLTCNFCRTDDGNILDYNPDKAPTSYIPKGKMPLEMYTSVIDEVKDYILLAILYNYGEPYLYKDLFKAIRYATDRGVATMVSTNGMSLNEVNCQKTVDAGLSFLKVAISGVTQNIHERSHRKGNINRVMRNLKTLSEVIQTNRSKIIVVVDYILYRYNQEEIGAARKFTKKLGFVFNVRIGNPQGLEEEFTGTRKPVLDGCEFPWKSLTVDWNGDLLACCEHAIWTGSNRYGKYEIGKTRISEVWNGSAVRDYRTTLSSLGRKAIAVCENCSREDIGFKS